MLQTRVLPIILLLCSNIFMTIAWYGHLRFRGAPLWQAVLASWGIALFEYWLAVPANRFGSYHYSVFQLKIIQEIITLTVFSVFAIWVLKSHLRWNHIAAFACIIAAVGFTFIGQSDKSPSTIETPRAEITPK
jgi:uncharacterized protein